MPLPIGSIAIFECLRCGGTVRVTMSDRGLRFADKDGQSRCPAITDKYIEYEALPFDDFALCESLVGEVERRYPSTPTR